MWDWRLLKHWSSTQHTIALSSGEAELAGIVKGTAEGIGLRSLAMDLGIPLKLEVLADSSAAIGMCHQAGVGKVRHLAAGELWVQDKVREKDFALVKCLGTHNPADLLTKHVPADLIDRHVAALGLHW